MQNVDGLHMIFLLLAFVTGWIVTGLMRRYCEKLRLVQAPNHRSSHETPTPHGGGIGIIAGCLVAGVCMTLLGNIAPIFIAVFALGLFLAIIGLCDDIESLPASVRFMIQLMACLALVWILLPPPLKFIFAPLWPVIVLIAGVWWINLFNFMDGIDGLASAQTVFMLLAVAFFSAATHPAAMATIPWWWMLVVSAATLGFLLHNWPPAKIFMGDAGSTYLAFMILALAFFSVHEHWMKYTAWLILGAVFITDATVTLLQRLCARQRWFEAHRLHAYQKLSRRFNSHKRVTLLIAGINLLWLAPLALASLTHPDQAFIYLAVAYLPLIAIALLCKAGRPEHV